MLTQSNESVRISRTMSHSENESCGERRVLESMYIREHRKISSAKSSNNTIYSHIKKFIAINYTHITHTLVRSLEIRQSLPRSAFKEMLISMPFSIQFAVYLGFRTS